LETGNFSLFVMWKVIFIFLILCNISLWFVVFTYPDGYLHVIACDVGQGDGILILKKTTQIIIDGGPGNKMVSCLDRHVPFWDRSIEIVMNTHPQLDHYEGLIDVFKRYNVHYFIANGLDAIAPEYKVLKTEVGSNGTKVVNPRKGMVITSDQISFSVLNPTAEFLKENTTPIANADAAKILGAYTSSLDPNEFSIIEKMKYQNFDALFTGDSDSVVEHMAVESGSLSDIEYLKVPHHGSKNGLTQEMLDALTPEIAVISDGKKNTYGHPHKEILDMLGKAKAQILRTDQLGDVEVVSDGERYWVRK
jgi:competence protein ComEC